MFTVVFGLIIGLVILACSAVNFGTAKLQPANKIIKVTVPEDLDYGSEIDTLVQEYSVTSELIAVKSVNMGSMFRLTYDVTLKDPDREKEFIDQLRCRNGNLEINVSRQETIATEL